MTNKNESAPDRSSEPRREIEGTGTRTVPRQKPTLRVLRSAASAKLRGPRYRCVVCLGTRRILLSTWPSISYARCPSCNGVPPTTGTRKVTFTVLDTTRKAA